jgi:co-chaperonin GroES (HSP10)
MFTPLNDRILVQRLTPPSLVALTDGDKSGKGVVLSTGPGKWMETSDGYPYRRPMQVKPGDVIRFTARWDDAEGAGLSEKFGIPDLALITEGDIWWVEQA